MESWIILLNVLLFLTWHGAESVSPSMTLYSELDEEGIFYTTTDAQYNLGTVGFDDMTDSMCGVGLWFLYEDPGFDTDSNFVHTFASHEYACENLDSSMLNLVTSLRYAGVDDIDSDTLTLYQDPNMCGGEYLIMRDVSNLDTFDDETTSLAVTGNSSWTIYEDPGYTGGSACIIPTETDGWYYGTWNIGLLDFPDDEITSVRKGCFSSNVYVYRSPELN